MNRSAKLALVLAAVALPACTDTSTLEPDDVLKVTFCPDAEDCRKVADGRSKITVRACLSDKVIDPKPDLEFDLHLSSGAWDDPSDPDSPRDLTMALGINRCTNPVFTMGTTLDAVRLEARVAGVDAEPTSLRDIEAALLWDPQVEPSPKLLPAGGGEVKLEVTVPTLDSEGNPTHDGVPTDGTTVRFEIVEPEDVSAYLTPSVVVLSGPKAESTLVLNGGVSAIMLRVTATPPSGGEAKSTTLKLSVKGG